MPLGPGFLRSQGGEDLGNTTFELPESVPASAWVTLPFEFRRTFAVPSEPSPAPGSTMAAIPPVPAPSPPQSSWMKPRLEIPARNHQRGGGDSDGGGGMRAVALWSGWFSGETTNRRPVQVGATRRFFHPQKMCGANNPCKRDLATAPNPYDTIENIDPFHRPPDDPRARLQRANIFAQLLPKSGSWVELKSFTFFCEYVGASAAGLPATTSSAGSKLQTLSSVRRGDRLYHSRFQIAFRPPT